MTQKLDFTKIYIKLLTEHGYIFQAALFTIQIQHSEYISLFYNLRGFINDSYSARRELKPHFVTGNIVLWYINKVHFHCVPGSCLNRTNVACRTRGLFLLAVCRLTDWRPQSGHRALFEED